MANWYIGQEIISKVTYADNKGRLLLSKGQEFVISAIRKGCKHAPIILQIGIKRLGAINDCDLCGIGFTDEEAWFGAGNFSPKLPPLQEVTYEKIKEELKVPVSAN